VVWSLCVPQGEAEGRAKVCVTGDQNRWNVFVSLSLCLSQPPVYVVLYVLLFCALHLGSNPGVAVFVPRGEAEGRGKVCVKL